jgi:uncharacterized coiled-coil DUF342 family protein
LQAREAAEVSVGELQVRLEGLGEAHAQRVAEVEAEAARLGERCEAAEREVAELAREMQEMQEELTGALS